MPTGYTAIIGDKRDVTFQEFASRCARAMGACIMQRDDAPDNLPRLDEEPSDYHITRLTEVGWELEKLRAMSEEEVESEYQEVLGRAKVLASERSREDGALASSYHRMIAEVLKWEPPTEDHEGLKEFMLQQLRDSLKHDCCNDYYQSEVDRLVAQSSAQWLTGKLEKAERDIVYHTDGDREERERVDSRNQWKRQLMGSLGIVTEPQRVEPAIRVGERRKSMPRYEVRDIEDCYVAIQAMADEIRIDRDRYYGDLVKAGKTITELEAVVERLQEQLHACREYLDFTKCNDPDERERLWRAARGAVGL